MLYMLKISEWNDTEPGEGGGLPYKPMQDVPFFQGIFQHKFLNCVLKAMSFKNFFEWKINTKY